MRNIKTLPKESAKSIEHRAEGIELKSKRKGKNSKKDRNP